MVFSKTSALRPAESHDTQKSECLARLSRRANEQRKTSRREASGDRNTGAITLVIAGQGLLFASKMQTLDLKGTDFSPCGDAHFQFGQQWLFPQAYESKQRPSEEALFRSLTPRTDFPGEVFLNDWAEAGLPKPSVARCSKLAQIPLTTLKESLLYAIE